MTTNLCVKCNKELIYFPDDEWVCANKDCTNYAPLTYTLKDLSNPIRR